MKKVCSKCKEEKELNTKNFCIRKSSKDGFDSECKLCKKKRDAERYQRKKKEILKEKKKYYEENKERIKVKRLDYYRKNREKCLKQSAEWDNKNPIRRRINFGRSRGNGGDLTVAEWIKCKEYFDDRCAYCGISEEACGERLHQEHVVPIVRGGRYTCTNIVPSCRSCNSKKRNKKFEIWYKKSDVYSKEREDKILSYLKEE